MRRINWKVARVVGSRWETASARTLQLDVEDWDGHLAGQHVDVRLTAADGYRAQRSYSIASAADGRRVEITVQRVADGEVSPYLVDQLSVGDAVELRGPVGGWFVWAPGDPDPVLLVAGGSGVVPLMAMVRARIASGSTAPFRLLYSVRTPDEVMYSDELAALPSGVDLTMLYTREAPDGEGRPARRISLQDLGKPPAEAPPAVYLCGPSGFVEAAATMLVTLGHDPARIRTERFGRGGRGA
jgi:ferredoxin-NADP reductase